MCENTASPDERCGVLVATMEAWEKDESLSQANYLKKRNAASSTDEKCKLMEARIKALQELFW